MDLPSYLERLSTGHPCEDFRSKILIALKQLRQCAEPSSISETSSADTKLNILLILVSCTFVGTILLILTRLGRRRAEDPYTNVCTNAWPSWQTRWSSTPTTTTSPPFDPSASLPPLPVASAQTKTDTVLDEITIRDQQPQLSQRLKTALANRDSNQVSVPEGKVGNVKVEARVDVHQAEDV